MASTNILNYLFMISNKNIFLNICIHILVIFAIACVYLLKNIKVKKYIFHGTILILFLSVTINAVVYGNPFHAITFGILTVIAVFQLVRGKNPIDMPEKGMKMIIAITFIIIGLWYPEFMNVNMIKYLMVSPTGIVPCPTLITTLGMLNLYYPKVNKLQFIVTVCFGVIYGFIGTIKLGVYLDLSLIAIAIYSIYNIMPNGKYTK